jgi:hypothetical protein
LRNLYLHSPMKVREPKEYREKLETFHALPEDMSDDSMKKWFNKHNPIQRRYVLRVWKLTWAMAYSNDVGTDHHLDVINHLNSISK